jgi:hypothetical protein
VGIDRLFKGHINFNPNAPDLNLDRRVDEDLKRRVEAQFLQDERTLPEGWQDVYERTGGRLFVGPCTCTPN